MMTGTRSAEMRTEFWHAAESLAAPHIHQAEEQCPNCHSEFAFNARYCHICGAERGAERVSESVNRFAWLKHYLNWNLLTDALGLNHAAAAAFCAGLFCSIAALLVGLIYQAQTTLDWEAIQLWRMEWLLGAVAAFVCAIVLRKQKA